MPPRLTRLLLGLAFAIAAIVTGVCISKADAQANACDVWRYDQWTDQQVRECLGGGQRLTEAFRTYVWEKAALNGLGLDMASHHHRQKSSRLDPALAAHVERLDERFQELKRFRPLDSLEALYTEWARHHFAELGGREFDPGTNKHAPLKVRFANLGKNLGSFNAVNDDSSLSGRALLVTINIQHPYYAQEGLLPYTVLLHEVAHAVAYTHDDHDWLGHNKDFRGLLMQAHLKFNPYFQHSHVDRACEIADMIGIGVTECDVAHPPAMTWTPLTTGSSECATDSQDDWAEWHTCHIHRADGPKVQLACREGHDAIHFKTDNTTWKVVTIAEAQAGFGSDVAHGWWGLNYLSESCGTPAPSADWLHGTQEGDST